MMNHYERQKQEIRNVIALFPSEFGLRAFPGERFCILERACYHTDLDTIMLYTGIRQKDGTWLSFCKGTIAELRSQITT